MSTAFRPRERHVFDFAAEVSEDHEEAADAARETLRLLTQLTAELQQGLEALSGSPPPDLQHGLDFYQEVRRFEIALIRRALIFMKGHQGKAGRLLNLKKSTLSAKIHRYQI
jgi:DNA-binding protein Fis